MNAFAAFASVVRINVSNFGQTMTMAYGALKKQYGGSFLGWAWSVIRSVIYVALYWFGISIGIRGNKPMTLADGTEVAYLFWLIPGLVAWFFFRDVLNMGVSCVRKQSHLVNKIVFPICTIPVFSVISYFITHVVVLLLAMLTFLIAGQGLSIYILQLLIIAPLFCLFCCIFCMFISSLAVISRDFEQLIKSVTIGFFWLTPVLWDISKLNNETAITIMKLNPFYYFVSMYRDAFLGQAWFFEHYRYTAYILVFMLLFALLTAWLQQKLEPDFADVL